MGGGGRRRAAGARVQALGIDTRVYHEPSSEAWRAAWQITEALLLQIHDELVFEAPESSADACRELVVRRMEAAMALSVNTALPPPVGMQQR